MIFLVDQTITIVGGAADAPPRDGLGIQLISKEGGIALTSEKGTIKINAKKLILKELRVLILKLMVK